MNREKILSILRAYYSFVSCRNAIVCKQTDFVSFDGLN